MIRVLTLAALVALPVTLNAQDVRVPPGTPGTVTMSPFPRGMSIATLWSWPSPRGSGWVSKAMSV